MRDRQASDAFVLGLAAAESDVLHGAAFTTGGNRAAQAAVFREKAAGMGMFPGCKVR